MLTAILADIHANREAFDACMAHAARAGADRYVFLGDIVGYGADPAYVVDRVRRLVEDGAVALLGNHDEAVVHSPAGFNADAARAVEWTRRQLDPAQAAFLAELPLSWEDGDRLFVHANAWAPGRWDYVLDAADAERSMRRTHARVTLCGHTHQPALYHMPPRQPAQPFTPTAGGAVALVPGRRWLAVLGSVGQPRDGDPAACYGLLADETLTWVRVPYPAEFAARKIVAAGLPMRLASRLLVGG